MLVYLVGFFGPISISIVVVAAAIVCAFAVGRGGSGGRVVSVSAVLVVDVAGGGVVERLAAGAVGAVASCLHFKAVFSVLK